MERLRIGISSCFFHADPLRPVFKGKTLQYLEQSLGHWVMSEGAIAYLIPSPLPGSPTQIPHFARDLDGLVLQGGSDVSPQSYGETALKPEWNGDSIRDVYEIALLKEFMAVKKPVLGVCRGAQLINVGLGGTLIQDIGTQRPDAVNHRNWDVYDQLNHEISIVPGTGMSRMFPGMTRATVNSVHHQAVKDLGKDLAVEARSSKDQIIEAFRLQSDTFVFAVQWHPEFHDSRNPDFLDGRPILLEFLNEARRRRGA